MKAILVREIIEESYSGQNSVKRIETIEVDIQWPAGFDRDALPQFSCAGSWTVAKVVS